MLKFSLVSILFVYAFFANAFTSQRLSGEAFNSAVERITGKSLKKQFWNTPLRLKDSINELDYGELYEFGSNQEMQNYFEYLRDQAFLDEPQASKSIMRRIPWLLPNDGCWVRAELMKELLIERSPDMLLDKVFIFGELVFQTEFASNGFVDWWFHVAPIAKLRHEIFVFDPSVDFKRPLSLQEWALRQVDSLEDAEFSICHGNTFRPTSPCKKPRKPRFDVIKKKAEPFLYWEKLNLEELNLNPDLLYANPPWLGSSL